MMAARSTLEESEGTVGPGERTCIVTRAVLPQAGLIRFVAGPDGRIVADLRGRLPGRGVWVRCAASAVREAARRNLFARALKRPVTLPDDLAGEVAALLKRDALQMLSLANKAGAVVSGFAKIEGQGRAMLALLQAVDGSAAELERLRRLCRGRGPGGRDPELIRAFTSAELSLSIGRELVIHASLSVQDVSSVCRDRASRYVEFQSDGPAKPETASASGPSGIVDAPEP